MLCAHGVKIEFPIMPEAYIVFLMYLMYQSIFVSACYVLIDLFFKAFHQVQKQHLLRKDSGAKLL